MRPVDADAVLLLLFAFTVVVISLLLLLQVYMVCFLRRAAAPQGRLPAGAAGSLLGVARDAAAVEGGEGEGACGAAADVSASWACLPGVSRGWVGDEEAGDCVVCLSALGEEGGAGGGGVRVLPKCRHAFHAWCIGRWLVSHSVCCPICRTPARPDTPAATASGRVVAATSPPPPPPPLTAAAVSGAAEAAGALGGGAMVEYLSQRGAVLLGEHHMTEDLHLPLLLLY